MIFAEFLSTDGLRQKIEPVSKKESPSKKNRPLSKLFQNVQSMKTQTDELFTNLIDQEKENSQKTNVGKLLKTLEEDFFEDPLEFISEEKQPSCNQTQPKKPKHDHQSSKSS
eukprot:Sdes_comp10649_c0_seq1m2346